ncbi:putative sulfatase [Jejuia pallidilutea]|uniref:Putative sulfatase n=1 Tax=Jejuia pallidilutea TaxID=504487 RepID=A0A362X0Y8_9FLAO|nr:sulfatase [Jejuia pallidilutea]PQV48399.1 putative sulfatase [Jejuia pallidilutea]
MLIKINVKGCLFTIGILFFYGCKSQEKINFDLETTDYNILWIIADDLGTDLSCYGNDLVYTPHLDKLASESVLHKKLFTVSAVCSPSRSSFITGMYPVTLGVHQHRTRLKKELPNNIKPITQYFKNAGYFVTNGHVNKIDAKGKMDYNFKAEFNDLYQGTHWRQRGKGQKFFSQIQVFYPHRPFHLDSLHPINPDLVKLPPYYPDHPLARKDWALYLETVQLVDVNVGKVLKQLEEDGLLDKTIIFFFGDQGRPHVRAKQFLYDSGINTPLMVRYPNGHKAGSVSNKLISNIDIPAATLALAGIEKPLYMQGQDFLSKAFKRTYVFSMRDRRDETVDRIRSVRSKKFKYIKNYYINKPYTQYNTYKEMHYPMLPLMHVMFEEGKLNDVQKPFMGLYRPTEELYDLEKDPFEINNLAENINYSTELKKLRAELNKWVKKNDLGTYPEDKNEIVTAQDEASKRLKIILKQRKLSENATNKELVEYWEKELLNK